MGPEGKVVNYMGSNLTPEFPGWMMRFKDYDSWDLIPKSIEVRPAWFVLLPVSPLPSRPKGIEYAGGRVLQVAVSFQP